MAKEKYDRNTKDYASSHQYRGGGTIGSYDPQRHAYTYPHQPAITRHEPGDWPEEFFTCLASYRQAAPSPDDAYWQQEPIHVQLIAIEQMPTKEERLLHDFRINLRISTLPEQDNALWKLFLANRSKLETLISQQIEEGSGYKLKIIFP